MPKVSVLIPSYNLGYVIGRTIESVIAQTFTDWEMIIEDDGSTDNSLEVIAPFLSDARISLVSRKQNEGQNKTTNNLVRMATGEYICLLPADDIWHPKKLARQVEFLDSNKEYGICFAYPQFQDDRDTPFKFADDAVATLKNMTKEQWQKRFMVGNCLFIATSMYRRSLHDEIGYFDEELKILADLEFYIRIVQKHELHIIQDVLATIRMRDNFANLSAPTAENRSKHADELEIVRARYNPRNIKKKKFMIATPFYEVKGYSPYIRSLVNCLGGLAKYTDIEYEYVEVSGDSYVWRARNNIADRFMKSDCSHLIFIDADEGWDPEGFYRLIQADAPVVGAAYPVKNNWEHFGVAVHTDQKGFPDVRSDGLIRASMVPTGFMKISRHVFERLRDAEPDNWYWEPDEYNTLGKKYNYFGHILEDHVIYGEDISFCKRWTRIGGELFVEPRVTIEHWGNQAWKGNYHEFLMRQPGGSKDPNLLKEAA